MPRRSELSFFRAGKVFFNTLAKPEREKEMKIKIDAANLKQILVTASGAFPKSGNCALKVITMKDKGLINLVAFDEAGYQAVVYTEASEFADLTDETYIINGRTFIEVLNALSAFGSEITINISDNKAVFSAKTGHVDVALVKGELPKSIGKAEKEPMFICGVKGEDLSAAIKAVEPALADNKAGSAADGIRLSITEDGKKVTVSVCSQTAGAFAQVPCEFRKGEKDPSKSIFLPRTFITAALLTEGDANLYVFDDRIAIQNRLNGFFVMAKKDAFPSGAFDIIVKNLKDENAQSLVLERNELVNALKLANLSYNKDNPVVLEKTEEKLRVSDYLNGSSVTIEAKGDAFDKTFISSKSILPLVLVTEGKIKLSIAEKCPAIGISTVDMGDSFWFNAKASTPK